MSNAELQDIVPDLTPLLQSGVTKPSIPDLWDEFQGVKNAAARAALVGTPLEDLQKQYRERFEKAVSFIEERAKIHNDAVNAENKRLMDLAQSLNKRQTELQAEIKPLRDSLPAVRIASIEFGEEVNSLRRKVRASHLQFQFQREEEVNEHRTKRRPSRQVNDDDSWLTRVWPFRKRPAPEPAEPSKPYEVKQPEIEDADVPPELVDLVNAAWKKYSIAQSEWSSAEERHTQVAKELASLESQITDTRIRLGGLDGYRVQILDAHDGAKLELEVQYGQIQAALLDAYDLAKASKRA